MIDITVSRLPMLIILGLLIFYSPLDWGGRHMRAATLVHFLILVLFILTFIKNNKIKYSPPYLSPYIPLFVISVLMSSYFSICLRPTIEEAIRLIDYLLLFWLITSLFDKKDSNYLIKIILAAGTIVSFAGIIFLLFSAGQDFRAYSTFYQSDAFAGYLLLLMPLAVCMSLGEFSFWARVFYMVQGVIFLSCLFLTQSRGAWLCCVVIFVLLLFSMRKQNFKSVIIKIVFFIVCSFLFVQFFPTVGKEHPMNEIVERASSIGDFGHSSVAARFQFWAGAVRIALKYPLCGIGLGNFGRIYPKVQQNILYFSHYTHNYYAQIASETGLISFILLMIIISIILLFGFKLIFSGNMDDRNDYIKSTGLFLAILASMMHSFIDVDWNFPSIPYLLWIEIALFFIFAAPIIPKQKIDFSSIKSKLFPIMVKVVLAFYMIATLFVFYSFWVGEVREEKARACQDENNIDNAVAYLADSLKWDPLNGEYHRSVGKIMFFYYKKLKKAEYLELSLKEMEIAVKLDPYKAAYHSDLGNYYLEKFYLGDKTYLPKVKEEFKKAIENDPINYPQFYSSLAELYITEENIPMAEKSYLTGANIIANLDDINGLWDFRREGVKSQLINANLGLAELYFSEKKFDNAEKYYKRVIKMEPNQFDANYGLGIVYFSTGNMKEAEKLIKNAMKSSKQTEGFYLLGVIQNRNNNTKEASDYFKKSLSLNSDFVPSLIELGQIYKLEKHEDKAKELWKKALKIEPDNKTIQSLLKT